MTHPHMPADEFRIATKLVSDILAAGHMISVNEGEGWAIRRSRDPAAILAAMASTDSDTLVIREGLTADRVGTVLLIYGNGSDLISDHSDNPATAALIESAYAIAETV